MALADPQSVTINTVANTLPRTGQGPSSGTFSTADGTVKMTVSHADTRSGRTRRSIRLDFAKIASDPLTAENTEFSMSATVVYDVPKRGYTITEQKQNADALKDLLAASSGAIVTKVLGGES